MAALAQNVDDTRAKLLQLQERMAARRTERQREKDTRRPPTPGTLAARAPAPARARRLLAPVRAAALPVRGAALAARFLLSRALVAVLAFLLGVAYADGRPKERQMRARAAFTAWAHAHPHLARLLAHPAVAPAAQAVQSVVQTVQPHAARAAAALQGALGSRPPSDLPPLPPPPPPVPAPAAAAVPPAAPASAPVPAAWKVAPVVPTPPAEPLPPPVADAPAPRRTSSAAAAAWEARWAAASEAGQRPAPGRLPKTQSLPVQPAPEPAPEASPRDRGAEIEAAQAARAAARKAAMLDVASKLEAGDQLTLAMRRRAAASEPELAAQVPPQAAAPVAPPPVVPPRIVPPPVVPPPALEPAPAALVRTSSVPSGAVAAARARLAELAAASSPRAVE